MRGYDYLEDWPLPTCNHPTEWVHTKAADMVDFKGKDNPDLSMGQEFVNICKKITV